MDRWMRKRGVGGPFADRRAAGRALAATLSPLEGWEDLLVLGLPRGGVPVAYEVARALEAPLDVLVVRKIGVPGHEELAMGAIASGNVEIVNEQVREKMRVSPADWDKAARRAREELGRREALFRGDSPPLAVAGKNVVVVDDGLATGSTMRAAVQAVKALSAAQVIVAVPTASRSTSASLAKDVDRFFCVSTPEPFEAVGMWYEDFSQTPEDEVCGLLSEAARRGPSRGRSL